MCRTMCSTIRAGHPATAPTAGPSRAFTREMAAKVTALPGTMCVDASEGRLAALFDAHHQRLYRLARRLSTNGDDARDLVQETFLRAAQKLASVPTEPTHQEAWLIRVLVNLSRDRWRRRAVRQRFEHQHTLDERSPALESVVIARTTIWSALQRLAARRRVILVMCEIEGLSIESVAQTLHITSATVRWHLARGRRELAKVIKASRRPTS